ncbi:protein DBF4 homolog B-like isoform X1 [Dermacentor albipictus]|uniref:protein DBF4 homolog B-like isoform X1 n=1 Tax=Dermacentor albipictus TaxID=60249 RepID=UPI0031FD77AF
MSSRTEARRILTVSKKKTDGQRYSRPLENKKFYLHFKNRRPPPQLSQDLSSLGARVEPFFGKDVSCVITDQQDLRPASTPPKPNSVDSSGPSTSPSVFVGPSTSTGRSSDLKSSRHTGRGQALVQKAMQNASGSTDVLELCRQWQIEVSYIKSFLPWLQKLKEKALLESAKHGKENAKTKQKSDLPQKIVPPFIKIEDMQCVFKPLYRSLKQWPDVTADRCQQRVPKPKESAPVPKEPAPLPKEPAEPVADSHLKGVLLRPGTSKVAPRVKVTEQKKLNCEICGCSYICLQKHLESEKHQKFMQNANNFSIVSDIISTLPCALPNRPAHPLSEINGQDWSMAGPAFPSTSGDEENVLGLTAGRPWSSPPQAVSVIKGHPGAVKQSGFSGTISALRHLKVTRKKSAPIAENPEEASTAGGSRLRKRPATFSDFETQAVVKDARMFLCCSDSCSKKEECVPPSFSSEPSGTTNNLLVGFNIVGGNPGCTSVKSAGNFDHNMSEFFDKASESLFSDSSTMEYSWTDVVSGVVPEPTLSRRQCDAASDPDSDDSFLQFVSRAIAEEQPKTSCAAGKKHRSSAANDEGLCLGSDVHTAVEPEPMTIRF